MRKLKILRIEKDWSQEVVAQKLGVSIPAYSKIETGITDVNLSRLRQLAEIYDKSLIDLLCFLENEKVEIKSSDIEEKNNKIIELTNEVIDLQRKVIHLSEVVINKTNSK
jgi:transcriptional regulator with XRE-family HTH domain